jgi:hypothetical protein
MSELVAMLTTDEAAKYIRLGAHALYQMRREHIGPTYIKLGRKVFYRIDDLDAYIATQKVVTNSNIGE